jgi:amidase
MTRGQVSSVELTKAAISQIERFDSTLNAICVRTFDKALEAARAADTERASGTAKALLGVPMTVKESFNVAGLPTSWGIPPFKDFIAREDALAVARVKAAGGVILGKTNVPVALGDLQTYNPIYGTTNNPWALDRTPGGSSGGSAAGLAAGYGALSIGSDIAGSLRVPSHCCGVYAHKPTYGLLPGRGHTPPPAPALPYERDLTVIGPMARSAADLTLLVELLAHPDETTLGMIYQTSLPAPRHDRLADYRVLIVDEHPAIPTSAHVRAAIAELAVDLEQAGARVARESALLPDLDESSRLYMRLFMASMGANLPPEVYANMRSGAATLDEADLGLAAERLRGSVMSHRDWVAADSARVQLRQRWRALFGEFDVVICPVLPTTAFVQDQSPDQWRRLVSIDGIEHSYADQLVWSGLATAPGLPATAMPIAHSPEGLPIGAWSHV